MDLTAWLGETVPGLLEATGTPGAAIAVAHRGRRWTAGFGTLRADSVVPAGSMAKPYTAVAMLQLTERGLIGLDDPVRPHLPDIDLVNPLGAREITVRDLLSFRSGLAVDTTAAALDADPPPLAQHVRAALRSPVLREYHAGFPRWTAPVGERYQYANLGIAVVGLLIERLSGGGCHAECLATSVLRPLGLRSSAFAPQGRPAALPPAVREAVAPGHARFGRDVLPTPALRSADHPANGLYTTATDHLRFLLALGDGGGLLRPETAALMRQPHAPIGDARIAPDGAWHAGLGLILGPGHYGHPGSHMWGWWHVSRVYPQLDLGVVVVTDCWDMLRWQDPLNEEPGSLLTDAIAAWAGDRVPAPELRPWRWRRSYVAGLVMAERTLGLLGAEGELRPDAGAGWDAEALALGAADVRAAGPCLTPIGELARTGSLRVGRFELDLILVALGARRGLPLPLSFWS